MPDTPPPHPKAERAAETPLERFFDLSAEGARLSANAAEADDIRIALRMETGALDRMLRARQALAEVAGGGGE